jgi:Ca2+/Na+ antiporter
MITAWDVYWILRLDVIGGFFIFIAIVIGIAFLVASAGFLIMGKSDYYEEAREGCKKISIWTGIIAFFVIPVALLTPSTKEACVIYLIPQIANNEQAQKVPENFAKLLNVKMEEWMKAAIIENVGKK